MLSDEHIKAYCKARGIKYDPTVLESFRELLNNAIKRAKNKERKTLMQRDF